MSCSCASGPAFEGAHIHAGMRAAPGAIERVQRIQGEWRIQTIEGLPPIGICGSGILDAVAEMLADGVIEGALKPIADRVGALLALDGVTDYKALLAVAQSKAPEVVT